MGRLAQEKGLPADLLFNQSVVQPLFYFFWLLSPKSGPVPKKNHDGETSKNSASGNASCLLVRQPFVRGPESMAQNGRAATFHQAVDRSSS